MSRLFDGNDLIRFSVPASGGPDWRYGTILRIVRIMTATDLSWQSGVEIENSAGAIRAAFGRRANGNLYFANDAGINDAVPVEDGDGWMLQAVTKATGTVAPVMHKVIMSSGTRTSTALGTTFADSPSSASGFIKLGGDDDPASERLSVSAVMPGIVLTTTEIDGIVAAKTTQSIADLCDANCLLVDDSNGFATDLIGGLTATITGTTDDADDPADWVYGLGGGGTSVTLTPATETDTAQALSFHKVVTLTPATEADTAQALSFYKSMTLTPAEETSTALALSLTRNITLSPAEEVDTAVGLNYAVLGGSSASRRIGYGSGVKQPDVEGIQSRS